VSPLTELRALQPRVVDRHALTPTQAGMLVHALRRGRASGVDVQQIALTARHSLDPALLVYAWYQVLERHPVLRSRLVWKGLDEPQQEVLDLVELPVERVDWRRLAPAVVRERLLQRAAHERESGFDLSQAPLMRLFLARVGDETWSLLWTFHHVLMDGRSFPIVLGEVFAIHDRLRAREETALPQPQAFRAFVEDWLQDIQAEAWPGAAQADPSWRFWRQTLQGLGPALPLAIAVPPPLAALAPATQREGARQCVWPLSRSDALRARAQDLQVSVNSLLQAAWALLLSRCGAGHDVVMGTTCSLRSRLAGDAQSGVGLFINTVPLRVQVDPQQPWTQWVQAVRQSWNALKPHAHMPLARMPALCGLESGQAMFESLYVYDHRSLHHALQALGPQWAARPAEHVGQTGYPLTFLAYGDPRLLLRIEYDRSRYSDSAIDRLLGHLQVVLSAMADGLPGRVADLPWLTAAERQALIGPPVKRLPAAGLLHEAFEAQVRRSPQAPALTVPDAPGGRLEWTYATLNARANHCARRLLQAGVAPDEVVGLRVDRGTEVPLGILSILKAGGAYLPLDPTLPMDRAAFMVADAGVRTVLVSPGRAHEWRGRSVQVVLLEDTLGGDDATDPGNLPAVVSPAARAYVIYTSGSTGQPKGVCVTHHNVGRLFEATRAQFHFDDRDVWTLFHSFAFDFSVWELWGALCHGGRLVLVSQALSRDVEAFAQVLVDERVTVLNQTPTAFRRLIDVACHGDSLPLSLRYVIFGGEALQPTMLRPWFARYGDQRPRLVNMYGITETTVHVTFRLLAADELDRLPGSVIGEPIADLKAYVLDAQGEPVPVGVPGELVVGGEGVALGYLNRPELTAERFVPDRFAGPGEPPSRLYRSGDLVRWLDNGELEYLGRLDQQLKIRGFRIEPGEIEAALTGQPQVRQAAVMAREDVPGDRRLVAYVVAHAAQPTQGDAARSLALVLREALRARLPEHMVPAHIVFVPELPLTANGKLDRAALPPPQADDRAGAAEAIRGGEPTDAQAPREIASRDALVGEGAEAAEAVEGKEGQEGKEGKEVAEAAAHAAGMRALSPTEAQIAAVWAEVLRVSPIDPDLHFFALGGDSILAIQVVSRCRQRGLTVRLKDVFDCPTVAQLARRVVSQQKPNLSGDETKPAAVSPAPASRPAPQDRLTPIQHWFFDQRFADAHHWNQAFAFAALRPVDADHLARAWHALLERHPALCQTFHIQPHGDWEIRQGSAQTQPPLWVIDLGGCDDAMAAAQIEERSTEAQAGLDLSNGPLTRALFFKLGPDRPARLVIAIHHLVVDGVSWRIIREDLDAALDAQRSGLPVPAIRPTGATMGDWALSLSRHAQHSATQESAEVWAEHAQPPRWALPTPAAAAAGRPVLQSMPMQRQAGLSPWHTAALLQQVPRQAGTPLQPVLLTALGLALQAATGLDRLRIDVEGHGREPLGEDTPDVAGTVGWFTSLYPFVLAMPHTVPGVVPVAAPVAVAAPGDLPPASTQAVGDDLAALATTALPAVATAWQRLPDRGLSYGLLRWLAPDAGLRERLGEAGAAPLLFNYLGQFDAVVSGSGWWRFAPESTGPWRSPRAHMAHPLEIVGQVRDGVLSFEANFDAAAVEPGWVQSMLDHMVRVLQALAEAAAGKPGLPAGAYALTPMQRLFHAADGVDARWALQPWQFELEGPLNPTRLQRALMRVVERHTALRSAFGHGPDGEPWQQPVAAPQLAWVDEDLRQLPAAEQARVLEQRLADDARRPFDLSQPALMRVRLLRMADARWHLLWVTHHLALDGWSWPLVMAEWSRAYASLESGLAPHEPDVPSFAAYVDWLARHPDEDARYWRDALAGFDLPTPLPRRWLPAMSTLAEPPQDQTVEEPLAEWRDVCSAEQVSALQDRCRAWQVTAGVLINAAWALVLAHWSGRLQVAHGLTLSGRPPEMPGIERLVGPCVNNLPVAVTVRGERPLRAWLQELQHQQFALAQHQTTPLDFIHEACGLPGRLRFFDSLLVIQNYRVDPDMARIGNRVRCTPISLPEATNVPVTLTVTLGESWRLRWMSGPMGPQLAVLQALGRSFAQTLQALVQGDEATLVTDVLKRLPSAVRGLAEQAQARTAAAPRAPAPISAPLQAATDAASQNWRPVRDALQGVWAELLGLPQVPVDVSVFELGAHSLTLVRAHRLINQRLGLQLPLVALLQHPSVESLARHIAAAKPSPPAACGPVSADVPGLPGTSPPSQPIPGLAAAALARARRARLAHEAPARPGLTGLPGDPPPASNG
jgi:amino acid adenylation domain-containing protein/non-ribosomal peptide synthase protein (TIGR01720 family)